MRKVILFLLITAMLLATSGCSLRHCDFCHSFGADNRTAYPDTYYLCDDCYYDYLDDMYNGGSYGYDYDYDYDYYDSEYYYIPNLK